MQIDLAALSVLEGYKLLSNLVVPRPIAWVTSADAHGRLNLAPFSFFNLLGSDPPIVAIGVGNDSRGQPKHTATNIAATREFVVNLVTEELMDAMNLTAADFPEGISEVEAAGLHTIRSVKIHVPRIAESKVSLECTLEQDLRIGTNHIILGQVLIVHIEDAMIDKAHHVHGFSPIGRLGSPSWYARTDRKFELPRIKYSEWSQSPR